MRSLEALSTRLRFLCSKSTLLNLSYNNIKCKTALRETCHTITNWGFFFVPPAKDLCCFLFTEHPQPATAQAQTTSPSLQSGNCPLQPQAASVARRLMEPSDFSAPRRLPTIMRDSIILDVSEQPPDDDDAISTVLKKATTMLQEEFLKERVAMNTIMEAHHREVSKNLMASLRPHLDELVRTGGATSDATTKRSQRDTSKTAPLYYIVV